LSPPDPGNSNQALGQLLEDAAITEDFFRGLTLDQLSEQFVCTVLLLGHDSLLRIGYRS